MPLPDGNRAELDRGDPPAGLSAEERRARTRSCTTSSRTTSPMPSRWTSARKRSTASQTRPSA